MHYNSKTEKNRNAKADFIAASPLISIVFDFHETLLDCIQEGDIDRLKLAMNKDFDQYQNTVMIDLDVARQVFVHDMSLAYFFAHRGGLSMNIGQKLCYYYHTTMMKARTIPVIQVLLKDMLLDFAWNVRQMRPAQTFPVLIRKCIEYIHAHIDEPFRLEDLSTYTGRSISTIQRYFSKSCSMNVSSYIDKERIRRACYLLDNTLMTGAEISSALGFCSQSSFISHFRRHTGKTPRQYRIASEETLNMFKMLQKSANKKTDPHFSKIERSAFYFVIQP